MVRTVKFDSAVREKCYDYLKVVMADSAEFIDAVRTVEGFTFAVGKDENGVDRYATVKVVVRGEDYDFEGDVAEYEKKVADAIERKAKAEKAKAEREAKKAEKGTK